jgi:hypothetical protein
VDKQELIELSENTKADGERLYSVASAIYKTSIICIYIIGIFGCLVASGIFIAGVSSNSPGMGILAFISIAISTAIICITLYVTAVMSTHIAKVLSLNSIINLRILEHFEGSKNEPAYDYPKKQVALGPVKEPSQDLTRMPNYQPSSAVPARRNIQIKYKQCPTCLAKIDETCDLCPECSHDFINKMPPKPRFGE